MRDQLSDREFQSAPTQPSDEGTGEAGPSNESESVFQQVDAPSGVTFPEGERRRSRRGRRGGRRRRRGRNDGGQPQGEPEVLAAESGGEDGGVEPQQADDFGSPPEAP